MENKMVNGQHETGYNWLIVDPNNELMRFKLTLFGIEAALPAIFTNEDAALEVLYAVQRQHPHTASFRIVKCLNQFGAWYS